MKTEKTHSAMIPPSGDPTSEGSFGTIFPRDILQRLPLSSWDLCNLSNASRFFSAVLQEQHATALIHQKHLRQLLRLKNVIPTIPLSETQKINIKYSITLLKAYKNYFSTFNKIHDQCRHNYHKGWLDNKELYESFEQIGIIERKLPNEIIQGTVVGILQATAKFLNVYAKEPIKKNLNWDELDKLAVKNIGGAQKDAGERIWARYCRGNSMKEELSFYSIEFCFTRSFDTELGSEFFIFVDTYLELSLRICNRMPPCLGPCNNRSTIKYINSPGFYFSSLYKNALSLIDVVSEHLKTCSMNFRTSHGQLINEEFKEEHLTATLPNEKQTSASTLPFFKNKLQNQHSIVFSHQEYLHQLLRLEDANLTTPLSKTQKADIQYIKTLLIAYKRYFSTFKSMQIQHFFYGWPNNKTLDEEAEQIKILAQSIPKKLIQCTVIGVLQATAKLSESYTEMATKTMINWAKLDKLAIKKLGSAQRLAGEKIWNCYFLGNAMKEESSRSIMYEEFMTDAKCFGPLINDHLGYDYYLACASNDSKIPNVPLPLDSAFASFLGMVEGHPAYFVSDGLSLIGVISERLDIELEKISAPQKSTKIHSM